MKAYIRLIKWLWRAWPVLVFIPLFFVYYLLFHYFSTSYSSYQINKAISLISQLAGGSLVLYSINSNIGVIKNKSIFNLLSAYFKEFPLNKCSASISVNGVSASSSIGRATVTVGRNPKTIEEKIDYLQEQITNLGRDLIAKSVELHEKIIAQSKEMDQKFQEATSDIRALESKIAEVTTGGIKMQLFGVLLLVTGAVTGYIA